MNTEPVTVTLEGNHTKSMGWIFGSRHPQNTTHRITFELIEGEVDCEKCPTCGSAKRVDMEKRNDL